MLVNHLYTIKNFEASEGKIIATVIINPQHKIFEGHFPGQPVLPGVCQIQILKELLEKSIDKELFLSEAANCKFLQMVVPTQNSILSISIDHNTTGFIVNANAMIKSEHAIHLKMNASFKIV